MLTVKVSKYKGMIVSFGDATTEDFYHGENSAKARRIPADAAKAARRKFDMLDAAVALEDLRIPPANRLEALKGDLAGFHSIRVNDQWRLIFRWADDGIHDVRFVDYHD